MLTHKWSSCRLVVVRLGCRSWPGGTVRPPTADPPRVRASALSWRAVGRPPTRRHPLATTSPRSAVDPAPGRFPTRVPRSRGGPLTAHLPDGTPCPRPFRLQLRCTLHRELRPWPLSLIFGRNGVSTPVRSRNRPDLGRNRVSAPFRLIRQYAAPPRSTSPSVGRNGRSGRSRPRNRPDLGRTRHCGRFRMIRLHSGRPTLAAPARLTAPSFALPAAFHTEMPCHQGCLAGRGQNSVP